MSAELSKYTGLGFQISEWMKRNAYHFRWNTELAEGAACAFGIEYVKGTGSPLDEWAEEACDWAERAAPAY